MRNLYYTGGIVLAVGLASGCGVVPPKVKYSPATSSNSPTMVHETGYPFRHRGSVLLITQDEKTNFIKAVAVPSELKSNGAYSPLFFISGVDNLRSTTQLKISYIDNTKIIDTINITTKDNVNDTINKAGTLVTAAVPLFAALASGQVSPISPATFKPTTLDPSEPDIEQWRADKINPDYCIRLRNINTEEGVSLMTYMSEHQSKEVNDYPAPSCAAAILDVAKCSGVNPPNINTSSILSQHVTYASASNVTPLPLPSTGVLKMNTVCGASVTEADKEDRTDLLTYLSTLITNVKTVQAEKEKTKQAAKEKEAKK
jgi:hypothetical protein